MMVFVLLRRFAQFVFAETVQSRPRSDVAYANDHAPAFWYLHGR
jgi:hypothetical protein